jgi:regulator of protease activity HflC (stomatin/prohibitin superfamily)
MDPEKRKKFLRALFIFAAITLLITIPKIFPLLVFLGILFFSFSASGKKFFQDLTNTEGKKTKQKPENDPLEAFRNHSSRRSAEEKNNESKILSSFEKFFSSPPNSKKPSSSFSLPPMNKFSFSALFLGLGVLIFVLLVLDGFVSVPPGNVAVVFDRGRGVLNEPLQEGLHIKIPFWQESKLFTTKNQIFTMAGEFVGKKDEDQINGRSKDGQNVSVDASVLYHIKGENAPMLRRKFLSEDGYKTTVVQPSSRSVIYDTISKFNAIDLTSDKREEFIQRIKKDLQTKFNDNTVVLDDVLIRNVSFSPEFSKAIEDKQIAEQRIQTAKNQKLEAEEIKEKTIIEAQAQAESIRLKGSALAENPSVIQLQFVEKMSPGITWGVLPNDVLPLLDMKSLQSNQ